MKFKNHLRSIKTTLIDYTSLEELRHSIPEFVCATWLDKTGDTTDDVLDRFNMTRDEVVDDMFNNRTLPTALETVRLTFKVEGIDLTGATHLIRHRGFSFSAQSAGPTALTEHDILENDSWEDYPDLLERARWLCEEINNMTKEALERGMSYYDARHYMPRAKECIYFMSGNIKDYLGFIRTRLGRTNQPTSDNILALRLRQEIIRVYPHLKDKIPVQQVQPYYIDCINRKMNYNDFPPDALHREYLDLHGMDYSEATFKTPMPRDEYPHMGKFEDLVAEILNEEKTGS